MSNPFLYAGELYDEESGLIYLRARYYDPNGGRFITEDRYKGQVDNQLSLNRYTYVHNNPISNVDPTGNCVWDACISEAAAPQNYKTPNKNPFSNCEHYERKCSLL
ncbi:RHS repeat-associated core domain-containing protein [Brevibacillus laterosporus]|nr:RHS repeat-associated core domain-containing protein [Brevibacillus laterosporus]TPG79488.1 RHS repeat-associated core domain-containing protein [Brevibacillus laterosporus]